MSTHIEWQPVVRGNRIDSTKLKGILEKEYGFPLKYEFKDSEYDTKFLEGLVAAEIQEAQELIDAIKKHGSIVVETHE